MVTQEKEINVITRSAGSIRIFTRKGYRSCFGKDPADDGVVGETWVTPSGETITAYKAGPCRDFGQTSLTITNNSARDGYSYVA